MADHGRVEAQLTIKVWTDGSMSIEGPTDPEWCLAALEHAKDAVKSRQLALAGRVIVPSRDVVLPGKL